MKLNWWENRVRPRPHQRLWQGRDTYYSLELGPMEGSGVNLSWLIVETSVEGEINWREVCC